jgi:outer membrane protein TolC
MMIQALIPAGAEVASTTLLAPAPLLEFADQVVNGNRSLLAAGHELASSLADKNRALADFSPQFSYTADSSKSANRSFNSVTGFEEDYSTRRHGGAAALIQKTPLGRISYEYSQSKTEYTSSQSS